MTKVWMVGNHKLWFDEKNHIFYTEVNGDFNLEEYLEHSQIQKEVFLNKDLKRHAIYKITGDLRLSREVRQAIQEEMKMDQERPDSIILEKTAFVGATQGLRVLFKIWTRISSVKNTKFFKTEQEAVNWLNT